MANVIELVTRLQGHPEVQRALKDLQADVGKLGQAANASVAPTARLTSSLTGLLTVAAGFVTAREVVRFLLSLDQAARQAERAQRSLAASLQGVGVSFGLLSRDVDQTIGRLERLTGIADDDLQRAFSRMIQITGDVQGSLGALSTAADLAAARQIDIQSASELVARALTGQTQMLRRYGIVLREGASAAEVLAAIQRQVGGQAASQMQAVDRLANAWDNFKERAGGPVKTALDALRTRLAAILEAAIATADALDRIGRAQAALAAAAGLAGSSPDRVAQGHAGRLPPPLVLGEEAMAAIQARQAAEAARARATVDELAREARRASVLEQRAAAQRAADRPINEVFDQLAASIRRAEREFLLFNDANAKTKALLEATRTALAELAKTDLSVVDARVLDLKDQFQDLERAVTGTVRELRFDRFTTERTFESAEIVRSAKAGQAALDALAVEQAEAALAALDAAQAFEVEAAALLKLLRAEALAQLNAVLVKQADDMLNALTAGQLEINRRQDEATKATTARWLALGDQVAQTFSAIVVHGQKASDALKALFRGLIDDLIQQFVRLAAQRFVVTVGVQAVPAGGAAGAGAAGASGLAAFAPAIGLAGTAGWVDFISAGAGTGTWTAQRAVTAGLTFGASEAFRGIDAKFFGGALTGGAGQRKAKRRASQVDQRVADLMALGIDEGTAQAIISQQEATRGEFGTGGAFFELGDFIDTASTAGLRGESAGRALGFVTNLDANRQQAVARLAGVSGGLAGFGPQAAETVQILQQGPEAILREWAKVETFFTRFEATLASVGQVLEQGLKAGFARAIDNFLGGSHRLLQDLRLGLREAIQAAIVEGIIQGVLVEGLVGPYITRLRDAIVKGTEDPAAVIREMAGQVPFWARTLEEILAPLRAPLNAISPAGAGALGVTVVPAFEHGGIVTEPTLAVIGEVPEAVVPLAGGRGVPLVIESLAVNVHLDADRFATVMYRKVPTVARLVGHLGR